MNDDNDHMTRTTNLDDYKVKHPIRTNRDMAGIRAPLPESMTSVELAREARRIGSKSRWGRYEAQLAKEYA